MFGESQKINDFERLHQVPSLKILKIEPNQNLRSVPSKLIGWFRGDLLYGRSRSRGRRLEIWRSEMSFYTIYIYTSFLY